MTRSIILIPPSEGKTPDGSGLPLASLDGPCKMMLDRVAAYKGDLSQLYGVKGKALAAACEANRNILTSPTLPAIERYSGVVYDGIGYATLSPRAKEFLNAHVRIVSALFGLLKPADPIPDYKLGMDKLEAARHWKPFVFERLRGNFVIDLLPQAHYKAVGYDIGIRMDFVLHRNGKPVPAGHSGKLIKGRFVRWLCEEGTTDPKDFGSFREDGWRFDGRSFIKM